MNRKLARILLLLAPLALLSLSAAATDIPVGYVIYDVTGTGSTAEFDIVNQSGPNASIFPDMTFPVTTSETLSGLSLTVNFSDGSTSTFGSSYFTDAGDGLSFNGGTIAIGGANPQPTSATLTGTFDVTSIVLNDGSADTIDSSFTATILPSLPPNLSDSDNAIIFASPTTTTVPTPEPSESILLLAGLLGLAMIARKRLAVDWRAVYATVRRAAMPVATALVCLLVIPAMASATVAHLNVVTSPSSGVSGVNDANVNGTGFPTTGTITPGNVEVLLSSAGCMLTSADPTVYATTTAITVTHILGTAYRIHFLIPASLASGTFNVWVMDTAAGDANFTSGNCSTIQLTHTSKALASCVPSSSLGVLAPVGVKGNVTAYVPNGAWASDITGIQVVQIENPTGPLDPPISVPTSGFVNSCAANPATDEVVCVDNSTDVLELTGSTINTVLTSSSNSAKGFTGGDCDNCGVVVDALNNKAIISMGLSGGAPGASGSGLQYLDLATNVFNPAFEMTFNVSENPLIDPTRALIVSPGEDANFTVLQVGSGDALTEFGNSIFSGDNEYDSAGEDCSTGIALSTSEFTNQLLVADLTQAIFNPPVPPATAGTWTAGAGNSALTVQTFPEFFNLAAGTSGISIAQGTSHLGIVAGEFGGSDVGVIQLPSTSGSGTPMVLDWADGPMPALPGGGSWENGLDPHTTTAYTSPNDGKAYGLMSNGDFTAPSFVAKIDLACFLALPRIAGTHSVNGDLGPCVTYVPAH